MTKVQNRYRCAIYTRKSTEEGLEQEFNTLDAQRSSCEAYILSQAGEGWEPLTKAYDDGGWSGGNMDRPAVKELLKDIAHGQVDIIVVYKVDRLTRSLMDFARMVELFDKHKVSFVSVTQAFNTTSSMGRLTLNVLLSFAQFERDVTGERIRDKIAASKARGMWMGGNVPMGYDAVERKLVINDQEADILRMMFERYLELGSVPVLAQELADKGVRSKRWTSARGNEHGGKILSCGALGHILNNHIYVGAIVHKGKAHKGLHDAIISKSLFKKVQSCLDTNRQKTRNQKTRAASSPLTSKIFDSNNHPMRPTFGYGRGTKLYRYYVSEGLLPNGKIVNTDSQEGIRVSAERIERLLLDRLKSLIPHDKNESYLFERMRRVQCLGDKLSVTLSQTNNIADSNTTLEAAQQIDASAKIEDGLLLLSVEGRAIKRGRTVKAKGHMLDAAERQQKLAGLVLMSHRKLREINASPLDIERHHEMIAPSNKWTRERVAIALLAPDVQKALLTGSVGADIDAESLLSANIPLEWDKQRLLFQV